MKTIGGLIFVGSVVYSLVLGVEGWFVDEAQRDQIAHAFPYLFAAMGVGAVLWFIGGIMGLFNREPQQPQQGTESQAEQVSRFDRPVYQRQPPSPYPGDQRSSKPSRPQDKPGDGWGTVNFNWKDSDKW